MASHFPEFPEPTLIDAQRSWTAVFESFDQRNDDIYYVVDIQENGYSVARFLAQVWLNPLNSAWDDPAFIRGVRREIHKVAVTGKTNTSYLGKMI
jgi:hypothetical protein